MRFVDLRRPSGQIVRLAKCGMFNAYIGTGGHFGCWFTIARTRTGAPSSARQLPQNYSMEAWRSSAASESVDRIPGVLFSRFEESISAAKSHRIRERAPPVALRFDSCKPAVSFRGVLRRVILDSH